MTENRAIKIIESTTFLTNSPDVMEAIEMAKVALEKQIPKEPRFGYNISDTLSVLHCECGNSIKVSHAIGIITNNDAPNYCSQCGQKLDWSDEE